MVYWAKRNGVCHMKKQLPLWLACFVLAMLGLALIAFAPGYDFSGFLLLGAAALAACFLLLARPAARKRRALRVLRGVLTVCVVIGLLAAVVTGYIIGTAARGDAGADCTYLIVLGAGVNGRTPSLSLRERIDAAYAYLTAHPGSFAVVSGGQGGGEDISEAQCMFDTLTARGIDPARIWMEDQATSTEENLRFSLSLIESRTGTRPDTVALVSSEYHLYRAERFAAQAGVTALGVPARTSWVTLRINYFLREIAAVWYYSLFGGI